MKEEIRRNLTEFAKDHQKISFAQLRDLLGTARKSAKPIMVWLDREGLTSWCGKETERTIRI